MLFFSRHRGSTAALPADDLADCTIADTLEFLACLMYNQKLYNVFFTTYYVEIAEKELRSIPALSRNTFFYVGR